MHKFLGTPGRLVNHVCKLRETETNQLSPFAHQQDLVSMGPASLCTDQGWASVRYPTQDFKHVLTLSQQAGSRIRDLFP